MTFNNQGNGFLRNSHVRFTVLFPFDSNSFTNSYEKSSVSLSKKNYFLLHLLGIYKLNSGSSVFRLFQLYCVEGGLSPQN